MREIVIVIADLYLGREAARPGARPGWATSPGVQVAPGIQQLARLGDKQALPLGWRAWVAHWVGVPEYANEAPASVAAASLAHVPADRAVWLATPVHLTAGLTSVHFDRRSILRLPGEELTALAASFRDIFGGSGLELHPLASGELLLSGPRSSAPATTVEPARVPLTSMAEALAAGDGAPALRRLSAEIEMWLHGHPVNDERARRGALPVAALWLWGGGAPVLSRPAAARAIADAAFGSDAYVRGLWRLARGESRPMPVDWSQMIGERRVERALVVVEIAELLHANSAWSLVDAVAELDRRLISPAFTALRRGELERLALLANDRRLSLCAADRWRLWRRLRRVPGDLEVLT